VPLSLKRLLEQYEVMQQAQRIILGKPPNKSDLAFAHPDGRPLDPGAVSHSFSKMLAREDYPIFDFMI
jgi:hypothetical protein